MNNLILTKETTFKDAIALLDRNGKGFLAITDEKEVLLGILTDGDVRRAILNDVKKLEDIINKNPTSVLEDVPRLKAVSMLKELHRKHMPVVDKRGKFIDVITLDDIEFDHKPNSVVIMAGGLGTRLGDLTKDTPKPMLHVGEKPMLMHIIESFNDFGFTNFVISVNYKAEKIKRFFQDGSEFGVTIEYIEEKRRLGTGGALGLLTRIPKHPFFVINGDVLTAVNYGDLLNFHIANTADATMCVIEFDMQIPYGVVANDDENNIVEIKEKPVHKFLVNSGIHVLDPKVLKFVPPDEYFDLPSLFNKIVSEGMRAKAYQIMDYWIDIGNPDDFYSANTRLQRGF